MTAVKEKMLKQSEENAMKMQSLMENLEEMNARLAEREEDKVGCVAYVVLSMHMSCYVSVVCKCVIPLWLLVL